MKLEKIEITHVGRVRSENQDSIFSIPDQGVFMVADGMGGEKAGAEASQQVIATVERMAREFFKKSANGPKAVEALAIDALQQANREVFEISVREPDKAGLGSTGSLLILTRGLYFASQVGDSRIYLVRGGNVKQVTRDHTVVWTLYESGVLTRDQLETHPERHLLTQCVGSNKPLEVDLFEGKLKVGDMFLICSDGLTGYAGEDEVIQILIDPVYTMEERGEKLLRAAMLGGGGDNVSIILVKVAALGPEDDWQPNELQPAAKLTPMPGKYVISDPPKPPESEPEEERVPSKKGPIALLIGLIAVLGLTLGILAMKPKRGEFLVTWSGDYELADAMVWDEGGLPVANAIPPGQRKELRFKVIRNKPYKLRVHLKGAVPLVKQIDATANPGEPIKIEPKKAGHLTLELGDPKLTNTIRIVREGEGDEKPEIVYEFSRGSSAEDEPLLEHDLDPDRKHQITAESNGGRTFQQRVQIQAEGSQSVSVTY